MSVSSNGAQANLYASDPAITPDGRYVAFDSFATNLVPGDTNGTIDVFVRDRATGITTRESVAQGGVEANGASLGPSISANGRFVAFYSSATNLVPGMARTQPQIYVRDRLLGVTTLVSVSTTGSPGDGSSFSPSISADGRFVSFYSGATNLVDGDTNGVSDVFTRDLLAGTTTRDSVASDGSQGNNSSFIPTLTSDGRYVAFASDANNLVPGDTGGEDIFVRDRFTGQTTLESVSASGVQLNGDSPSISGDGRFVSFIRRSLNELYLRDRQTGETIIVSANVQVAEPKLNPDGRYLMFTRSGTVVAYDRLTAQSFPLAAGVSPVAALNAAAFGTSAPLVPEDTNGSTDVYVFGEPVGSGAPGAPTDLTGTSTGSSVILDWSAPSSGIATSYVIEAGSRSGAADLANFGTGTNATAFFASAVASGTYFVRVRAANASGISPPSNEVVLTVGSACSFPTAPSNLVSTVFGRTITLTWVAGLRASSYVLLVGSGPGRSDILVTDLGSAATSLVAPNAPPGSYFARVQASNACGQSGPSNETVIVVP